MKVINCFSSLLRVVASPWEGWYLTAVIFTVVHLSILCCKLVWHLSMCFVVMDCTWNMSCDIGVSLEGKLCYYQIKFILTPHITKKLNWVFTIKDK